MNLSEKGLGVLTQWERRRRKVYKCFAGVWTIGFGHALTEEELASGVIKVGACLIHWRGGITEEECDLILRQDVRRFEKCVERSVQAPLNQSQFDSLTIFCFNIGELAFRQSTLVRKLNAGDYDAVPQEMRRWNKVKGKVCDGLINRREAEIVFWNNQTAYA